jgi:hypothetical protein
MVRKSTTSQQLQNIGLRVALSKWQMQLEHVLQGIK